MDTLFDLLKGYDLKPKRNERGELLQYFSLQVERPIRVVAVRLSHYTLSDLYALRSAYNDRLGREGTETARKYWWAISRREKLSPSEDLQ